MTKSITRSLPSFQAHSKGTIEGYASYFHHLDSQQDQIASGAFQKTIREWRSRHQFPKMLWQHDPRQPIGIWTFLQEDHQGLYVKGRLALGTTRADEAYILLKEGVLDNLSIGFRTRKSYANKKDNSRVLLDIDLIEISLVTFGANTKATVHHIKAL